MAEGDFTFFEQFYVDESIGLHQPLSHVYKMGIIDSTITPTAADVTPAWGATSGIDYDGNEVATGTSYSAGGPSLSSAAVTLTSGDAELDFDDVVIAQDASGFTDGRWGIMYNETDPNNRAIGFVDLGSNKSVQAGQVSIVWSVNGVGRKGLGTLT